jgi:hypothetical protein
MRITTETQNLMVIKEGSLLPYALGIIFAVLGIIMILNPALFVQKPPLWFSIIFFLGGLSVIFFTTQTFITLDKNAKKLFFASKRLIGKKETAYDLSQIKEIEIQEGYYTHTEMKGPSVSTRGGTTRTLSFVMKDGSRIPFNAGNRITSSGFQISKPKEGMIGTRVAQFLGVSFQDRRPPTAGEILSEVKETIEQQIEKAQREKSNPQN